ncbi:MAG: hypothetical protein LBL28_07450 [Treponema sp.]|jgi:hypothetical protein|nr:hypothetical protein [Treponema sp.]
MNKRKKTAIGIICFFHIVSVVFSQESSNDVTVVTYHYDMDEIVENMKELELESAYINKDMLITNIGKLPGGDTYYYDDTFFILDSDDNIIVYLPDNNYIPINDIITKDWKKLYPDNNYSGIEPAKMTVKRSNVIAAYKNMLIAFLRINIPDKNNGTIYEIERYVFIQINDVSAEERVEFFPINLGHIVEYYSTDRYTFLKDIESIEVGENKIYFIEKTGVISIFEIKRGTIEYIRHDIYENIIDGGINDGEKLFCINNKIIKYNLRTGEKNILGRQIKPRDYSYLLNGYYLYEDDDGKNFIINSETLVSIPEPGEPYYYFHMFDNGFFYSAMMDSTYQMGENTHTIFLYNKEPSQLTKKIIIEGSGAALLHDLTIKNNTVYVARVGNIGFSINIDTGNVLKAYHCPYPPTNGYSHPAFVLWGDDEIIFTRTIYHGK